MLDKNIIKIYLADYLYKLKTDFLEWFYPNLALDFFYGYRNVLQIQVLNVGDPIMDISNKN